MCVTHVTTGPFSCLTHLEIVLLLLHVLKGSPTVFMCIPPPTVPQYAEQCPVLQQAPAKSLRDHSLITQFICKYQRLSQTPFMFFHLCTFETTSFTKTHDWKNHAVRRVQVQHCILQTDGAEAAERVYSFSFFLFFKLSASTVYSKDCAVILQRESEWYLLSSVASVFIWAGKAGVPSWVPTRRHSGGLRGRRKQVWWADDLWSALLTMMREVILHDSPPLYLHIHHPASASPCVCALLQLQTDGSNILPVSAFILGADRLRCSPSADKVINLLLHNCFRNPPPNHPSI